MDLIALKCPNCGAQLECDSLRELLYCQFCGCKIAVKGTEKQKVTIDYTESLSSTIKLAIVALSSQKYKEARVLIDRALGYDGNCVDAMLLKIAIETIDGNDAGAYEELAKKCTNNLHLFTEEDIEKHIIEHKIVQTSDIPSKNPMKAAIILPDDHFSDKFKRFEIFDECGIVGRGQPGPIYEFSFWNGRTNIIRLVEVEKGGLFDKRTTYELPVRPIKGGVYKIVLKYGRYEIRKYE